MEEENRSLKTRLKAIEDLFALLAGNEDSLLARLNMLDERTQQVVTSLNGLASTASASRREQGQASHTGVFYSKAEVVQVCNLLLSNGFFYLNGKHGILSTLTLEDKATATATEYATSAAAVEEAVCRKFRHRTMRIFNKVTGMYLCQLFLYAQERLTTSAPVLREVEEEFPSAVAALRAGISELGPTSPKPLALKKMRKHLEPSSRVAIKVFLTAGQGTDLLDTNDDGEEVVKWQSLLLKLKSTRVISTFFKMVCPATAEHPIDKGDWWKHDVKPRIGAFLCMAKQRAIAVLFTSAGLESPTVEVVANQYPKRPMGPFRPNWCAPEWNTNFRAANEIEIDESASPTADASQSDIPCSLDDYNDFDDDE